MTTEMNEQTAQELDTPNSIETSTEENVLNSNEEAAEQIEASSEEQLFSKSRMEEIVEQRLARQERKFRRELQKLQQNVPMASQPAPVQEQVPDFTNDPLGLIRYEARQEAREEFQSLQEKQVKEMQKRQEELEIAKFQNKLQKFAAQTPDFQDALDDAHANVGFTNELVQHISVLPERNAEVMYYLAKNPTELERIQALPLHQQATEIIRVGMKMNNVKQKVSQAAPPLSNQRPLGTTARRNPNDYESIKEQTLNYYKGLHQP